MFKRITFTLLAAAMTFGATILSTTGSETNTAAPNANAANGAVYGSTGRSPVPANFVPKYNEAQIASAQKPPVHYYCVNPGQVALTFDDGPNPATTPIVLDYLKANQIPATFFVNGENWSDLNTQPEAVDLIKRAYQEGHIIGSHTYYHQQLYYSCGNNTVAPNIDLMTDKIQEIIGAKPLFFRPPEGKGAGDAKTPEEQVWEDQIQRYLGAAGFQTIMWGADTNDWLFRANYTEELNSLDKDMKAEGRSPQTSSFIVLMHDVFDTTANIALDKVVQHIKELGYKFVSLPECLGLPSGYQVEKPVDSYNLNNKAVEANDDKSGASIVEVKMMYATILAMILAIFILF